MTAADRPAPARPDLAPPDPASPDPAPPAPYRAWPEGYRAWRAASDAVLGDGLDPVVRDLVLVRVSQLHGCAHCLDRHVAEALEAGEDPRRLHVLAAWRDVEWSTPAERAALDLAEQVSRAAEGRVPSLEAIARAVEHLGEEGYARLLLAIVVIGGWNRINVATRLPPRRRAAAAPPG